MATTVIITLLVAAGSLTAVVFAWLGRPSNPIMLFGLAGATVLAAFLVIVSRAEGPVILIAAIIMGLAGLALIVTPASLLIWEAYRAHRAHRSKTPSSPGESRADESKA